MEEGAGASVDHMWRRRVPRRVDQTTALLWNPGLEFLWADRGDGVGNHPKSEVRGWPGIDRRPHRKLEGLCAGHESPARADRSGRGTLYRGSRFGARVSAETGVDRRALRRRSTR